MLVENASDGLSVGLTEGAKVGPLLGANDGDMVGDNETAVECLNGVRKCADPAYRE